MIKKTLIFFFLIIILSFDLLAALKSGELNRSYRGLRPLGMGGAHIAVANDYNALFYNPAGLNDVEEWKVEVATLGVGISSQIKNLYNNRDNLGGDVTKLAGIVEGSIGKNHHIGFEFVPSFVKKNFGFALVEDLKLNIRIRNQAVPEVGINAKNDLMAVSGFSMRFWDRFQFGLAAKCIYRMKSEDTLSAMSVLNDNIKLKNILKEGQGYGLDLGFNYILPLPFKQKIGFLAADILNTRFDMNLIKLVDEAGTPSEISRTFNIGYKIEPPALFYIRPVVAIDFRDLLNATDSSYMKRFHIGTEIKLPFIFSLRFGFGQGFFAFGVGADFWLLTIDFVTFAEELGVGYQNPDRRYYVRLSFGF